MNHEYSTSRLSPVADIFKRISIEFFVQNFKAFHLGIGETDFNLHTNLNESMEIVRIVVFGIR